AVSGIGPLFLLGDSLTTRDGGRGRMTTRKLLALALGVLLLVGACATDSQSTTTTVPTTAATDETPAPDETTTVPDSDEAPDTTQPETTEPAAPQELTRLTYRLDFLAGGLHVPFVWGVESGIYEQHGLDLRILEGRGSALTFQLVAEGADPLGHVDGGVYALGKAETPDAGLMTAVWVQDNPADLLFACDQNIESPADLAGKSIAAAPGDAVVSLLPALLSQYDLTLNDLDIRSVAPAARITTVIE